jgi:hypothetical protein|tara:strand:- start:78 stop:254 length:177 start_codon:yes stop_codon:yes gene_type:complete
MKKKSPDGIELALLHALRYEEACFNASDTKKQWDLNEEETKAVAKWINNRMNDIKDRL